MNLGWQQCLINDVPTLACVEVIIERLILVVSSLMMVGLFVMLIAGSLRYLTSGGNPEKLKKAQGALVWAVGGTMLFVVSFLILRTVDVLFLGGQGKLYRLDLPFPNLGSSTSSSNTAQPPPALKPQPGATRPPPSSAVSAPLPTTPDTLKEQILRKNLAILVNRFPENQRVYQQASQITGVPVNVLSGIHFVEGGAHPQRSLVSGRVIGQNEPDVVAAEKKGCNSQTGGVGVPIPVGPGQCGFATLLDSAVYAGNHLKKKTGGTISSFQKLVTALARYNGIGNANCGRSPYTGCPRGYEGEDHPYPLNLYDVRHETMYLIYCTDHTKCLPPRSYPLPGVLTVARALEK